MEVGKIVAHHPTTLGRIVIRYPQQGDAPAMLDYINNLSQEQTFIMMQGEQLTLDKEQQWLDSLITDMASHQRVPLVATINQQVVGIASVRLHAQVESHVGELDISVAKDFRDQGLGSVMFRLVNQLAEQHLPNLRLITLGVFGNNPRAYHVYQKHGFQEYGRLPQGLHHRGQYVDHIYMYRLIRPC